MKNYINGMVIPSGMNLDEIVAETVGSTDGAISHKTESISGEKGRFHKAFDYVADKAGVVLSKVLNKSEAILSGVGLAALIVVGSADAEARTKCTNPVIQVEQCFNKRGGEKGNICLSTIRVIKCNDDDKFELIYKTDADGISLKQMDTSQPNQLLYHLRANPKNIGFGNNYFNIVYYLVDEDYAVIAKYPSDGREFERIPLKYEKRSYKLIIHPKISYSHLFGNNSEWLKALNPELSGSFKVSFSPKVDDVNFFLIAQSNAYNHFSKSRTNVGFGGEMRRLFRTIPFGGFLALGYNNVDFSSATTEVQFTVFGDEIGNCTLSPLDDFEYKASASWVFNPNHNNTGGLFTVDGSLESLFDIGKIGSLYLLGIHADGQMKQWIDVPQTERATFKGDRYVQVGVGPKIRVVFNSLDDFRIDFKLKPFYSPGKDEDTTEVLFTVGGEL